jgi:5-methylthioadenosine/S-adenosylhomocysteine deaminase
MAGLTGKGASPSVIFFDFIGTLIRRDAEGFHPLPGVVELLRSLPPDQAIGLLCNAGTGSRAVSLVQVLAEVNIREHFNPDLIINASALLRPLPDHRAFRVAAVLSGMSIRRCVFVSNNPLMRLAAAAAGMKTETTLAPGPVGVDSQAGLGVNVARGQREALAADATDRTVTDPAAIFRAGEVDEDTGPTFILRGRVVTMNAGGDVFEGGRIVIERGKIVHMLPAGEPVPDPYNSALELDTGGTIYPGLIDLHNHFVYNAIPLWEVPKRYKNRNQWPKEKAYDSNISLPARALAGSADTARALVRFIEAKAIVGGTTTGQGIKTKISGSIKLFRGAMRNVEETDDPRLPEAGTRVPNLKDDPEDIESFRKALETRAAYFYHLSEGVDEASRVYYTQLVENDLLRGSLAGIHALALLPKDYDALAAAGAKVVWSPFSNMLLYGQTLDLRALKQSGVVFSIGCDWSPTGSKNLLEELKVARYANEKQGAGLTARDLVRAVTVDAARAVGWQKQLGVLRRGAMADMLVIEGGAGDPYDHLIDATESLVSLVTVHGVARYGDRGVMKRLNSIPHPLENLEVGGAAKTFQFYTPDSEINDLKLKNAQDTLHAAMADMPGFVGGLREDIGRLSELRADEPQPFTVVLDNEFGSPLEERLAFDASLASLARMDWSGIAQSLELDALEVNTESYWKLVRAQRNIDKELVALLENAYSV